MKSPEQHSPPGATSEWMDARIEAYLDGDLPADETTAFERRLSEHPRWQRAVRRARKVKDGLRALPRRTCPPDVTRAVLRDVRGSDRRRPAQRLARPAADRAPRRAGRSPAPRNETPARWWQPPLAMGVLLAVVLTAALLGSPFPPEPPSERFTQAQIERATAEAEWTLAFLSRMARKTGATVQRDVLEARVVAPVRNAFDTDEDASTSVDTSSNTSDENS